MQPEVTHSCEIADNDAEEDKGNQQQIGETRDGLKSSDSEGLLKKIMQPEVAHNCEIADDDSEEDEHKVLSKLIFCLTNPERQR